ncbi:hypothetical protein B0T24DRAFT_530518 [Lasiosphaeria ovina]|uniref:Uncharacterized protein n=1 Tax=Lasiosphaeria ovina TaxID=92902 RepID=A0AAE0N535_9PEZI|nr:hypothetical protein B0T24DRAFT_530518 [Lasiosphaeria ovina]
MANNTGGGRHVSHSNESYDWLLNHHRANLVQTVSSRLPSSFWVRRLDGVDQNKGLGGRKGFRVQFAELQRMKMRKLQIKLLRHVAAMTKPGEQPTKPQSEAAGGGEAKGSKEIKWTDWEDDLEAYSNYKNQSTLLRTAGRTLIDLKAVRDYDYMIGFAGTDDDPFVTSSEHRVDHKILEEEMHKANIDFGFLAEIHPKDTTIIPTGPWSPDDEPIWGRRYLANVTSAWERTAQRVFAIFAAYTFVLLPVIGIILATLIPDQGDSVEARLSPFIILVAFVAMWGLTTSIVTPDNVFWPIRIRLET